MTIKQLEALANAAASLSNFTDNLLSMQHDYLKAFLSEFFENPEPLLDTLGEKGVPSLVLLESTDFGNAASKYLCSITINARIARPEENFSGVAFFYDTELRPGDTYILKTDDPELTPSLTRADFWIR